MQKITSIIVDDEQSDTLALPRRYGVDDLPVIIQDRSFDAGGQLVYSPDHADADGWLGDTVVAFPPNAPGGHFLHSGPEGSMRQVWEAGRVTEVDEFQGEIVRLGAAHGVETPVNVRVMGLI